MALNCGGCNVLPSNADIDRRRLSSLSTPKAGKRAMSLFKPKDPLFEIRVWDSFGRQEVMRTLAIEIALLEPGEITLTMP